MSTFVLVFSPVFTVLLLATAPFVLLVLAGYLGFLYWRGSFDDGLVFSRDLLEWSCLGAAAVAIFLLIRVRIRLRRPLERLVTS